MLHHRGYSGFFSRRTLLCSVLLLFFSVFITEITGLRANVNYEFTCTQVYSPDILKVGFSDFRSFSITRDLPVNPLTKKHPVNNEKSQPLSDQCFFKEGHRAAADRKPEPALLSCSEKFSYFALNSRIFISCLPSVILSSRIGDCFKIRPPPIFQ
jgi:hypothetical protein